MSALPFTPPVRAGAPVPAKFQRPLNWQNSGRQTTPEIGGEEVIGTEGIRHHLTPEIDMFVSFSYDNNDAKWIRTGLTFKF